MSEPLGFTKDELEKLYKLANKICGPSNIFDLAYRCKPASYWDSIRETGNGLMETYVKDSSGHPRNHINGKLNGLFFCVNISGYSSLPACSPYGDKRLCLPAQQLLDPTVVNLYFCDFYCCRLLSVSEPPHYVTIVVCRKDSESDLFCKDKLIPLPTDNPFLKISDVDGEYKFEVSGTVWVELYYTENIQLDMDNLKLDDVDVRGKRRTSPGGIPNNPHCAKCNLEEWLKVETVKVTSVEGITNLM
uniref:PHYHIP_C domain-containing protein n=1 Tax=Panagrellus redivivus TaxID=6233 RepID=A0A7E4V5I0_PANRE